MRLIIHSKAMMSKVSGEWMHLLNHVLEVCDAIFVSANEDVGEIKKALAGQIDDSKSFMGSNDSFSEGDLFLSLVGLDIHEYPLSSSFAECASVVAIDFTKPESKAFAEAAIQKQINVILSSQIPTEVPAALDPRIATRLLYLPPSVPEEPIVHRPTKGLAVVRDEMSGNQLSTVYRSISGVFGISGSNNQVTLNSESTIDWLTDELKNSDVILNDAATSRAYLLTSVAAAASSSHCVSWREPSPFLIWKHWRTQIACPHYIDSAIIAQGRLRETCTSAVSLIKTLLARPRPAGLRRLQGPFFPSNQLEKLNDVLSHREADFLDSDIQLLLELFERESEKPACEGIHEKDVGYDSSFDDPAYRATTLANLSYWNSLPADSEWREKHAESYKIELERLVRYTLYRGPTKVTRLDFIEYYRSFSKWLEVCRQVKPNKVEANLEVSQPGQINAYSRLSLTSVAFGPIIGAIGKILNPDISTYAEFDHVSASELIQYERDHGLAAPLSYQLQIFLKLGVFDYDALFDIADQGTKQFGWAEGLYVTVGNTLVMHRQFALAREAYDKQVPHLADLTDKQRLTIVSLGAVSEYPEISRVWESIENVDDLAGSTAEDPNTLFPLVVALSRCGFLPERSKVLCEECIRKQPEISELLFLLEHDPSKGIGLTGEMGRELERFVSQVERNLNHESTTIAADNH